MYLLLILLFCGKGIRNSVANNIEIYVYYIVKKYKLSVSRLDFLTFYSDFFL